MELSLSNSSSFRFRRYDFVPRLHSFSRLGSFHTFSSNKSISVRRPLIWRQPRLLRIKAQTAIDGNSSDDFIIEDVPHLTYFLPDLPSYTNPLKRSQAYAIVKKTFVNPEDMVAKEIIVQKDSPRGIHFRRAGPREKVFFTPEEVRACIVTCGGLCPGINTVIREIVCGLKNMYGVDDVLGIQGGYSGFYSKNTLNLTTKVVNDIHKRGGTFLQTSRGGHDTKKIVDNIQDRGINQVYIIGGDGTQKGAAAIYKEVEKRGIKVAVAGIPKTIDNDIAVIDKSFGFDTAVEEAQRAINAAHVEAESVENGVGIVKLMGRYSGFIAMLATLGNRDVDCCLIPESPFYLEGPGGLYEYVEQQLKENRHVLIVLAEGAGQEYVAQSMQAFQEKDASGNRLLLDVGLWLTQHIKDHFTNVRKMTINMKYIGSIGDYDCINIDMAPEISLHRTFTIQKQRYYEILAVTNENLVGHVNASYLCDPHKARSQTGYLFTYRDPTYMIRAIPSNASDNIYCTLLAQSAVHGAMAGFTGFTVGPVNSRHAYIPINRVTETTNTVNITGRMWARLLASTNQPSFVHHCQTVREKVDKQTIDAINNMQINSI